MARPYAARLCMLPLLRIIEGGGMPIALASVASSVTVGGGAERQVGLSPGVICGLETESELCGYLPSGTNRDTMCRHVRGGCTRD